MVNLVRKEALKMRAVFDRKLNQLRQSFEAMGLAVNQQIQAATQAFIDHDKAAAQLLIDADQATNTAEVNLEQQALELIVLQQPVANDFRTIISILKASSDLERIGDHAVNIARETINVKGNTRLPEVEAKIAVMAGKVRTMLIQMLKADLSLDATTARNCAQQDRLIDQLYQAIRQEIVLANQATPAASLASTSYLLVIRLLERIGDHIVNLAEWIVYSVSGEIVDLT
jgi:phosphate transport system protein